MKPIRMCTDIHLTVPQFLRARAMAAVEHPANVPHPLTLASLAMNHAPPPLRMALLTGNKWAPGKTLRIGFHEGSDTSRSLVMAAARELETYANVSLVQVNTGASEIRCGFVEGGGCWSVVGTDSLGMDDNTATMNIDSWADHGTCMHELCHALGMVHEHQLPDGGIRWNVPVVLAYYEGPPNSWSEAETIQNVIDTYNAGSLTNGGYDKHSIMEYAIEAELLLDPSQAVGWNSVLSAEDKAFLGRIYPKVS
jgi:hypothetical protein